MAAPARKGRFRAAAVGEENSVKATSSGGATAKRQSSASAAQITGAASASRSPAARQSAAVERTGEKRSFSRSPSRSSPQWQRRMRPVSRKAAAG